MFSYKHAPCHVWGKLTLKKIIHCLFEIQVDLASCVLSGNPPAKE